MSSNIAIFPLRQVLNWRDDNRIKAEVNTIDAKIRAKELEIGKLAHDIWLLKLERQGLTNE